MSKVGKTTIYTGNIIAKNCWKQGEKEHPVELPRDVQYYWRMGRNPKPNTIFSQNSNLFLFTVLPVSNRSGTLCGTVFILSERLPSSRSQIKLFLTDF